MTQVESGGEIAEVQLLQLYLDVNQDIDTQFQVWISITFAVLVASFVAGPRLNRIARLAIVAMYVSAAVILYLRYTRAASYIPYTIDLFVRYQVAIPQTVGALAYELRRGLFILGSAITALAVLVPGLGHRLEATVTQPPGPRPEAPPDQRIPSGGDR
jgi:hypothetical protein